MDSLQNPRMRTHPSLSQQMQSYIYFWWNGSFQTEAQCQFFLCLQKIAPHNDQTCNTYTPSKEGTDTWFLVWSHISITWMCFSTNLSAKRKIGECIVQTMCYFSLCKCKAHGIKKMHGIKNETFILIMKSIYMCIFTTEEGKYHLQNFTYLSTYEELSVFSHQHFCFIIV